MPADPTTIPLPPDPATVPHVHTPASILDDRAARILTDIGAKYLERLALDDELVRLPPGASIDQWSRLHKRLQAADVALVNLRAELARLNPQEP